MQKRISKKFFFYFFLFSLLGTLNNKFFNNFELPKLRSIEIIGFDKKKYSLLKDMEIFTLKSLFFLDQNKITKLLNSHELIDEYSVFKRYPSSLQINIIETKFLANVKKDGKFFYFASNGNLIEAQEEIKEIPYIFGKFDKQNFFILKNIIDKSNLNFKEIKKLFFFPSGRWDIELNSGVIIKLPKDQLKESLNLTINLLRNKSFENTKLIDVRQESQVILNGK